jgi:hypothetical protein
MVVADFKDIGERHYGVSVKYYNNDNQQLFDKRMDYDVRVNVTEGTVGWQLSIAKENIFFNQHEPDAINEILSQHISSALYPVETEVDEKLVNLKGITNHDQIIKRWENNKNKIRDKYAGDTITELIRIADIKFGSKARIEKAMKYDLFWNLFFHPRYLDYGGNAGVRTDLYLAIVPYKFPVRFSGKQTVNLQVTAYYAVQVNFTSDEMDAPDYLIPDGQKGKPYYMKVDVVFDLDARHFFPMHTRANFELYFRDAEGKIQSARRIGFTMYQLNTVIKEDKFNIVINREEPATKKSRLMKFIDALVGDD